MNGAGIRLDEAQQQSRDRALARSGLADNAQRPSTLDAETDVIDNAPGLAAAMHGIRFYQVRNFHQRHGSRVSRHVSTCYADIGTVARFGLFGASAGCRARL